MPYTLRSADAEDKERGSSEAESDGEHDITIVGNAAAMPQTNVAAEQMSAIIASINALKTSVEGLRHSTVESQRDLERLSAQIQPSNEVLPLQPRETATPTTTSNESPVMSLAEGVSNYRLYDLPTFSGHADEWPLFRASFNDTTIAFGYSDRQNLMRLHKCLSGAAREAVASMLIFPNDVKNAMEELEFRFGRPDLMVRFQLQKIKQIPSIPENKLEQIISFSTTVRNVVAFLISAGCQQHLANPSLLDQLVSKMPVNKQFEWAKHATSIKPFPTVQNFSVWLCDLAKVVCLMPSSGSAPIRSGVSQQQQPRRVMHVNEDDSKRQVKCYQCAEAHMLADCKIFQRSLNVMDRWQKVKGLQLCFACLRKGHNSLNCRNKKVCGINGCRRHHHQLLHEEQNQNSCMPKSASYASNQPSTQVNTNMPPMRHNDNLYRPESTNRAATSSSMHTAAQPLLNCRSSNTSCSQLFKMFPVTLFGPNGSVDVYAMFDDGSAITILEENTAHTLGLKGRHQPLTLQWYGQGAVTETSMRVNLEMCGFDEVTKYNLKNVRTIRNLCLPSQSFNKMDYRHFECLPLNNYANVKPVLLIGLDNVHLSVATAVMQDGDNNPIATKTKVGWVVFGPAKATSPVQPIVLHIKEEQSLQELTKLVAEYFEGDSFGIDSSKPLLESVDNTKARKILENTTQRVGHHFETGLIWKKFPPNLPSSYEMAERRLIGIEKKMSRDKNFADKYKIEMNKYFEKGYARKLDMDDVQDENCPIWYLPHFAVHNPHKPDKMRIVFDAAAAVAETSLNSVLLKGPEQAKPLLMILFKFREGPIAVAADIREMFSQVKIRAADQNAQRFLWRDGDTSQPPQDCVMSSMIFGAICSPCCAEYVKNQNAERFRKQYPAAVDAIINKHYVDDFVCSFKTEEEAQEICLKVVHIHADAGFELRNFVSNLSKIQNAMNEKQLKVLDELSMERQATTEKVLGMFWDTTQDVFKFNTKFHRISSEVLCGQRAPTKRELLGIVIAVYDPFGLLADFLIFSKMLVQETWKLKISWDDPIPANLHQKWMAWWGEFEKINTFKINRCYSPLLQKSSDVQLHIFVDASQSAFAAVGYIRIAYQGHIDVAFIAGKTRCAPQKLMSIPRLELQAAVLGARLSKLISQSHDIKFSKVIFWSDSRTVLHWIYSAERKFKPFVGHRIAAIHNISQPSQWRWVPTNQNTADSATRAVFPPRFNANSPWVTGPAFVKLFDEDLVFATITPPLEPLDEEVKPCLHIQSQASGQFLHFSNFSSFVKLIRTMAWVLRAAKLFLSYIRGKQSLPARGLLTAFEVQNAEEFICRLVQHNVFASEVAALKDNQPIARQSSLFSLTPILDECGLLRIGGRIDEATCLPYSARRPIILPQKHLVSDLIMRQYHEKNHHQNSAVTINELRQKFWIPHAKSVLRGVQRSCLSCKIERAKPAPPFMGQLPSDRVTPFVRPFTYTGVDLFGSFYVSVGRRREKRWAVIFTCLTVRAAHLEIAQDLSTDAFLLTLRNFVNRRGTPVRIRSDNGTNFIGAQKELKASERLLDTDRIQDEATARKIDWVFNCPANPSSGGCWERLIRIIKRLLYRTLHEEAPRVETLRAVLIEAENIINSRPLTDIPLTAEEDEPLTPNHFLLGCVNSTQTPHEVETEICLRKQWHIAQNLKDRLWKRWTIEYLPQLLCRPKWNDRTVPFRKGDLVLVCDPSQPRSQWRKGRITQTFPAKDGHVRIVEVKTSNGSYRRPVSRLAFLDVNGESPRNSRGAECNERLV